MGRSGRLVKRTRTVLESDLRRRAPRSTAQTFTPPPACVSTDIAVSRTHSWNLITFSEPSPASAACRSCVVTSVMRSPRLTRFAMHPPLVRLRGAPGFRRQLCTARIATPDRSEPQTAERRGSLPAARKVEQARDDHHDERGERVRHQDERQFASDRRPQATQTAEAPRAVMSLGCHCFPSRGGFDCRSQARRDRCGMPRVQRVPFRVEARRDRWHRGDSKPPPTRKMATGVHRDELSLARSAMRARRQCRPSAALRSCAGPCPTRRGGSRMRVMPSGML
jgi:hypothetical protein